MVKKALSFIPISKAIDSGYGSYSRIRRWIASGAVHSYIDDTSRHRRMVCVEDCEAQRDRHNREISEQEIIDALAKQLANVAPALSPEGKERLAEWLR